MKIVNILFSLLLLLFLIACSEDENTIQPELADLDDTNPSIRVIHSSYDAPAVDITLTDGTVVFGNIEFKKYTDFLPLDFGSYDLQVRVAGNDTVVLELNQVNLANGNIYTVYAKGLLAGNGKTSLGAEIITNNLLLNN